MRRVLGITVALIHGINSSGRWQRAVASVLSPHFDCLEVRYRQYRWFGGLKLILEPWIFAPCLAAAVLAHVRFKSTETALALVLAGLWMANWAKRYRLGRALRTVARQLGSTGAPERRHVVAHSLGTLLAVRAAESFPAITLDRVVLCGSVLPEGYDWTPHLGDPATGRVWNEVGDRDWVAWLAHRAGRLAPGLGRAGLRGFSGPSNTVHTLAGPRKDCEVCGTPPAPVHNVRIGHFRHSDAFVVRAHAATFWLPFLWGFSIPDYDRFIVLCHLAASYQAKHDRPAVVILERELRERSWEWAGGRSLESYAEERLKTQQGSLDKRVRPDSELIDEITGLVWMSIGRAVVECRSRKPRKSVIEVLWPSVAFDRAAREVLQ